MAVSAVPKVVVPKSPASTLRRNPTAAWRHLDVVLLGCVVAYTAARAQPAIDCKSCPAERKICRQAHSQQACDSEYAMCMKHCRKT